MALITDTRPLIFAIVASTFFTSQAVADDRKIDSETINVWAPFFVKEFGREFATELAESGLSESDAAEIINKLSVAAANCFSESLLQVSDQASSDIGTPSIAAYDEGQLKHLLDACFLAALANAGLTLD